MKNINKYLLHLIALISIMGLVLVHHIVEQDQEHKKEVYELKTEVRELEFQLEMATWNIEMMNKEREAE